MDAILIFDPSNYLVFAKYNKQFLNEISSIAFESKLIEASSSKKLRRVLYNNFEDLKSVVVLLFAPYVASIRVLGGNCPPLDFFEAKSVSVQTCYAEYNEYIYLLVTDGNNYRDRKQMQQRVDMMMEITKFVFGASISEMRNDAKQAHLVSAMFDNWLDYQTFPSFLLEATERILVNGSLQETFSTLLSDVLHKVRLLLSSRETPAHAYLFVDNKLLSAVNSRNSERICDADQALLLLLINTLITSRNVLYESRSVISTTEEEYDGDYDSGDSLVAKRKQKDDTTSAMSETSDSCGSHKFCEVERFLLFLRSQRDRRYNVPYNLKFLRLTDRISVVILNELTSKETAWHIQNLLYILNSLQYKPKDLRCFHTLHSFDNSVNKLKSCLSQGKTLPVPVRTLLTKFHQMPRSGIKKFILTIDESEPSSQLDATCSSLCSSLREVHDLVIYRHQRSAIEKAERNREINRHLHIIKDELCFQMRAYDEYLLVKSARNISVEAYRHIIPGLVAFIYVDRNYNEFVIAMSDDMTDAIGDYNISQSNMTLDILPHMIQTAYSGLMSGKMASKWTDNGLLFCFHLWFEDSSGSTLKAPAKQIKLDGLPSIICSNFIEQIMPCKNINPTGKNTSINCYEIFYIQKLSESQGSDTSKQAMRLAAKLWEQTCYSSQRMMTLN